MFGNSPPYLNLIPLFLVLIESLAINGGDSWSSWDFLKEGAASLLATLSKINLPYHVSTHVLLMLLKYQIQHFLTVVMNCYRLLFSFPLSYFRFALLPSSTSSLPKINFSASNPRANVNTVFDFVVMFFSPFFCYVL